jgi:hypothetical protein
MGAVPDATPVPSDRYFQMSGLRNKKKQEYAEAAVLCIRDYECEVVEKCFMELGLVGTQDMLNALDRLSPTEYIHPEALLG